MTKRKHEGWASYRLAQNPSESRFAQEWQAWQDKHNVLQLIKGRGKLHADLTEEEIAAAASAIQWLGSPLGQCFLREVLMAEECPSDLSLLAMVWKRS